MKGATTLPCVITTSAPMSAITRMIGSSQYFLRTRRKAQSSRRKDMAWLSELVLERIGGRPGGIAVNPVASRLRIAPQPQRILAEEPHRDSGRHDDPIEEDRERDGARDAVQQLAEPQPQPVERRERSRDHDRGAEEDERRDQRPETHGRTAPQRQQRHDREEGRENEAECAIGGAVAVVARHGRQNWK